MEDVEDAPAPAAKRQKRDFFQHRYGSINSRGFVLEQYASGASFRDYPSRDADPNYYDINDDDEIVMAAVKSYGRHLEGVSSRLRDDRSIVLAAIRKDGRAFEFASERLQGDRDIALQAVQSNAAAMPFASESLRNDREIIIAAIRSKEQSVVLKYTSSDNPVRDDREIVLEAVGFQGMDLQFASPRLRDDKDVVLAAVAQDGRAIQFAASRFQVDREVALVAVGSVGAALAVLPLELQGDRGVVTRAIQNDGRAISHATEELRYDRSLVIEAIKKSSSGEVYSNYLDHELSGDPAVAACAVGCGFPLSDVRIQNRDIVLAALGYDGLQIRELSADLRSDKEIALTALKAGDSGYIYSMLDIDEGIILNQVSSELRNDPDVVAAAIEHQSYSQDEFDFMWECCGENIKKELSTVASTYTAWKRCQEATSHSTEQSTVNDFFCSLRSAAWAKVRALQFFPSPVRELIVQYSDVRDSLRSANMALRLEPVIAATASYKEISELEMLEDWDQNGPYRPRQSDDEEESNNGEEDD